MRISNNQFFNAVRTFRQGPTPDTSTAQRELYDRIAIAVILIIRGRQGISLDEDMVFDERSRDQVADFLEQQNQTDLQWLKAIVQEVKLVSPWSLATQQ